VEREGFGLGGWGAVLALTELVVPQLTEQDDEAGGGEGSEHQRDDGQPLHVV